MPFLEHVDGIVGLGACLGQDSDDRLADKADFVARQDLVGWTVVVLEFTGPVAGQISWQRGVYVGGGQHGHHARQLARGRDVDVPETRVRVWTASESELHQSRQDEVFEVCAAAGNEPRILAAFDRHAQHVGSDHHAASVPDPGNAAETSRMPRNLGGRVPRTVCHKKFGRLRLVL